MRSGTSASSAPSSAVTPADVPAPPAAVTAVTAGSGSLSVSWTPQSNGGAAITSYTVTPYIGHDRGDAGDRQRVATGDLDDGHGAHQRHDLHVQVTATNAVRHRAPRRELPTRPPRSARRKPAPARSSGPRSPASPTPVTQLVGQPRDRIHDRHERLRHRHAFLQGVHQHGHPRRQPVERQRDAAGPGHVHQRDGLGLAAGAASPRRWR